MNRRILIVDDEPDYLEIYQEILTGTGPMSVGNLALAPAINPATDFELALCKTGEEALTCVEKAVRTGKPMAGMFLDLRVKGISCFEIVRRAKELDPNLLFVLTTDQPDPIRVEVGQPAPNLDEIQRLFGIDFSDRWDFILKPFSQWEIVQKANSLVSDWDRRFREREYLSQIRTQQDQLLQTERLAAMGNLAKNLGREFGNLIQKIMTRADLALQKKEAAFMEQSMKQIVETCEKASPIVRNLQSLSQTDARREKVAIDLLLKDVVTLVSLEAKKANVKIAEELENPSPSALVSRHEVNQAFLNIALNAIQAMENKGGTLTVKTQSDKAGVTVFFKDTGVGIAEENLQKIFEPLFTTKAGFGTGLGVSATKRIVESHGGRLSVSSEIGVGTTFSCWFPKL